MKFDYFGVMHYFFKN